MADSIFADREKLPPQKFGDDNYENMVNYIMRQGTIAPTKYAEAGLNDLSWRQRTADGVASAAEYLGMSPYEARKFAGNDRRHEPKALRKAWACLTSLLLGWFSQLMKPTETSRSAETPRNSDCFISWGRHWWCILCS